MSVMDEVREHESLGRDFLIWLWFNSETIGGGYDLGDGEEVELWFEGKITLRSEGDGFTETVTCTGENARIREARFALMGEKKVTRAKMHLKAGDDDWSFELDSTWMNFHALKTPRIVEDKEDDPDALFYERVSMLEKPIAIMDRLFSAYLEARLSPAWETEDLPAMVHWVREGVSA